MTRPALLACLELVAVRAAQYVAEGMPRRYAEHVALAVLRGEARGAAPPCGCARCAPEGRA